MLKVEWVYSIRKHNHQMEDEAQELFLFYQVAFVISPWSDTHAF